MLTRLKPSIHLLLFLLIGLSLLTLLTSCTDVPATNPYDPNTPEVQQVKGSIKGRVYLPQTDQDLSVFDTGKVLLYPLSFSLSNALRCQTDDFQRALRSSDLSPLEGRVAAFDFTDVQSNEYLMVVCVLGYEALFELVQVQRGQETNHTYTLSVPNEEVIDSGVVGTLRLEGQDMEYGSVRIETVGRPFSALSTSDGQFRLSIPPGRYSLKFTIVGFQTLILADVNVSSRSYNELEEVVLQKDLSASVSGQLTTSIEGFEWTSRSFITLVGDTETRQEIPNRLGEFEFNLLQPGVYTLDVFAEGHLIFNKTLLLNNGENRLDPFELIAQFESVDASYPLMGHAFLSDQSLLSEGANHSGTIVQAFVDDALVSTTQTDETGLFILPASAFNYRLRFIHTGYTPTYLDVVWNDLCGREVCFEPLIQPNTPLESYTDTLLQAIPARVRGLVTLSPLSTPTRLQNTLLAFSLSREDSFSISEYPTVNGEFNLDGFIPGDYQLRVTSEGYRPIEIPLKLHPDELYDLGQLNLVHLSTTEAAVPFVGRIRLEHAQNHLGTDVRILRNETDQLIQTVQTDINGQFTAHLASDEAYQISISRPSYALPSSEQLGTFTWQDNDNVFLNEQGQSLDVILTEIPLNGTLTIPIHILPDWIPEEQRFAQVIIQQQNGLNRRVIDGVSESQSVVINDLPAGDYLVSVVRRGFKTATWTTQLTPTAPNASPSSPLTIYLESLANAQLDLDGQVLNACDLRLSTQESISFDDLYRGGNFSGAIMIGSYGAIDHEECLGCRDLNACSPFNFSNSTFTNTIFSHVNFGMADFSSPPDQPVNLSRSQLFGAQCDGVNFSGANLTFANLFGVSAQGSNFAQADLRSANLTSAQLNQARFAKTDGEYPNTLQLDFDGDGEQETIDHPWAGLRRPEQPLANHVCSTGSAQSAAHLDNVNFSQSDLSDAFLVGISLETANLYNAQLTRTDLRWSCLRGADLNLVDLSEATLDGANADHLSMINAILKNTNVRGVSLKNANLASAIMEQTFFSERVPINNDDPCLTLLPWCEYERSGCSEGNQGLCTQSPQPRACSCRTQLTHSNLNGANLIGANFTNADLYNVSTLGVTVGLSRQTPRRQPSSCRPELIESCADICEMFTQSGGVNLIECSEFVSDCRQAEPSEAFFGFSTPLDYTCIMNYLYANSLPYSVDQISGEVFMSCQELHGDLPQRPIKCTFDTILETIRLEENGESCTQDPLADQFECCPADRIPIACTHASTAFENARLSESSLTGTQFNGVDLKKSLIENADFQNSELTHLNFDQSTLTNSSFIGADIQNVSFINADLTNVDFTSTQMRKANFSGANLSNLDLRESTIINPNFNESFTSLDNNLVATQVSFQGRTDPVVEPKDFHSIHWPNADLRETEFTHIVMRNPYLVGADFQRTTLNEVDFVFDPLLSQPFDLSGVRFFDAYLSKVKIHSDPSLSLSDLYLAESSTLEFEWAYSTVSNIDIYATRFANANFLNLSFVDGRIEDSSFISIECFDCETIHQNTKMRYVDFSNLSLARNTFRAVYLQDILFDECLMSSTLFDHSHLMNVRFTNTNLSYSTFKGVYAQVSFENTNLQTISFDIENGCGSELQGLNNGGISSPLDLSSRDLQNSDLRGICNLTELNLTETNLNGAKICRQYQDVLVGYQGQPIWMTCTILPKCPKDPECSSEF